MNEWTRQSRIEGAGTTGTSADLNSNIIDFASNGGFEKARAIGFQSVSNASTLLKFQVGTASGALSDTTGDVPGLTKTLYMEVDRPIQRFGRFVFKGATTTGAFRSLITEAYGARVQPTTQPASTTGGYFQSPGTGTATG